MTKVSKTGAQACDQSCDQSCDQKKKACGCSQGPFFWSKIFGHNFGHPSGEPSGRPSEKCYPTSGMDCKNFGHNFGHTFGHNWSQHWSQLWSQLWAQLWSQLWSHVWAHSGSRNPPERILRSSYPLAAQSVTRGFLRFWFQSCSPAPESEKKIQNLVTIARAPRAAERHMIIKSVQVEDLVDHLHQGGNLPM